jgi:colanic acid biosynthesis glycosyl transferase WcaI
MKILLINQCFYPDVVSSAQHLTDLAQELAGSGHEVTVLAGRRGYDDPNLRFPKKEVWRGVSIIRIASAGFGKGSRFSRTIDFGSFLLCCMIRLLYFPRVDMIVAMTSPPLISFLAALFAQLKRARFYCWIMDLNPDEAIAAGWLRKESFAAKILSAMSAYSAKKARKLIVLDRFVKERLDAKGLCADKTAIVPPWSHDRHVYYSPEGRASFRAEYGLTEKFVVMYSGNHSPCHPLDTLLQAACQLGHRSDIQFLFIGGGSEFGKAKEFAERHSLRNVGFLPYQPLIRLSETLSSADLHVAVMGDSFSGIVHPCKIYNILATGIPFLYIGPEQSHIGDIIQRLGNRRSVYSVRHGDVRSAVQRILEARKESVSGNLETLRDLGEYFSGTRLLPKMLEALECHPATVGRSGISWDSVVENSGVTR